MIISNFVNSSRVEVLHPLFKKLFDFVRSYDFSRVLPWGGLI